MHAVIHRLSTWLSTALSVHIAIYEIYSEDTTGHRITTSADAGMMFVGSYRKVRGYVSSDTSIRAFRYEPPKVVGTVLKAMTARNINKNTETAR